MAERPADESQIIKYSWEQMDLLHRKLARQMREQSYLPDVIVGIMRCGQVPAIHLSYIMGVRSVASILVKTTPSDEPLTFQRISPEVTIFAPDDYFRSLKILLVDAVMESGTTVELCMAALEKYKPADIKTAIMVDWYTSSYKIASGKRPHIDFSGDKAIMWPDFPWEH